MNPNRLLPFCFAFLIFVQEAGAASTKVSKVSKIKGLGLTATLSHRVVKPGQSVELLITVRGAVSPVSAQLECPQCLESRAGRRSPQHLITGGEELWILKYMIIPKTIGDYEIPPIRVSDGSCSALSKPLILHVSDDGRPLPPDARELSLTTDIPMVLAQEAVKTFPTPAPKAKATPVPVDARPFPSKMLSSLGRGITWFWNYSGK